MSKQRLTAIALIVVLIASFTVLLSIGSEIYREKPPIPTAFVNEQGSPIFTKNDIEQGQLVWRSMGGHQLGSIWGHGSYVAPDWTADWLHKEAQAWLDITAKARHNLPFNELNSQVQAALEQALREDIRANSVVTDPQGNSVITLSATRIQAIGQVVEHYLALFGDDPKLSVLREQYAMKEGTVPDLARREKLNAFLFWGAWAAVTERQGESYTYTNNWPYDPQIGNTPTSDNIVWSILSIITLIAGIGGLVWHHASGKHESLPQPAEQDPLFLTKPTPSQKAVGKYFVTAIGLFLLQIFLGGITAHYAVEGQNFYGIPLSEILPYSVTRTWHTQLAVFWIATAWLGTGLYIAPALSGYEPKFQRLGVNVLWIALVIVVLGSMAGEWIGVQQYFDLDMNFLFGHQGYEYIDLGRVWQVLLLGGLLIWLALVTASIRPALKVKGEMRPVIWVLYASCVAIGLFYGAGLMMGKHTNLAIAEYWRWWVVHLWVEGFFETFATSVIALMLVRLGLIRARSANAAVLFTTVIFLTGGLIGTLHHLYFTGTPTSVIAWGAIFSALEVVPLALIGFEAVESYRLRNASPWMIRYKWAIMFFVATAFWNLVGAGILGFLINPPIALYFIQGLNTTATHGHAAFMGVYGMLGMGLMLFCLRGLSGQIQWNEKWLKGAFWSLNIGLAAMVFMSLLPVGITQFFAVLENGYWFARSPEVIHSPLVETLVWMRMPGDILFGAGGLFMGVFLFDLIKKALAKSKGKVEQGEPLPAAT
ncbi:nitric-oxide reductase large subunit [Shewanella colwelliana]|uniref:Nitric-oxide reductase large subunit n=1 Tax=Shewanella colwelliana TaxID=23 RepID=A0A1E5IWE9_SHECO|nr:nitric-oxide reductase large subunit [Shewanella colwelliana]MDX1283222.1 nitric-oxide reductase large subunit [Shewanella colwelliana]OEG74899.1 nitric oxide reductase large subunit [Shewanella colwelliana]GIU37084.1 nitric-oxide reductase large subunit [Shewanella colwelliana]